MKKRIFSCLLTVMAFLALTFSCKQHGGQSGSTNTKLIVRFDGSVKVLRANSSIVSTEDVVNEGEELILSPSNLENGQFVSSWIINGVALQDSAQGKFLYKVKKSDAKTEGSFNVLNISFNTTSSEKLIIKFTDDILCKDLLSSMKVLSETEVTEGEELEFNAILSEDEACENWYINNVKLPISSPYFPYVVKKEDAKIENGVPTINISFKKTMSKKLIIRFDDNNIWAIDENKERIFNDDEVNTSNVLTFTANIEAGKTVDFWFVGNTKQENQTSRTFVYTPAEKDAVNDGDKKVITIKCEKRDSKKVRIDFNQDDIYTSTGMESGTMVDDGTFILFNSKFTPHSYSPTWYVNDKKQPAQSLGGDPYYDNFIQTFKYTVDIKDAIDEGSVKVIKVSYKVPDKNKKLTITFPDDVVVIVTGVGKVQSGYQIGSGETLGVQASYGYEGDDYGQTVALDSWFLNDKKIGYPKIILNPTIYYTGGSALAYICKIDEDDADANGTVNITYTTHQRKEVSIEFDSTIEVYKGPKGAQTSIDSGTLVKEDTFLSFEKTTSSGEYFDNHFYFNGKKWETGFSSDLYLLNANDAVEKDGIWVLKVTTKTRPENEIKVVWSDSNMACQESSSATNVESGDSVPEGTSLIFTYNLTDDTKIIRGFFTDGKDDSHILARNIDSDKVEGCILKTALEYCKKEGGVYVLHPRFQLDDKEKVTIKFDSSITCKDVDNDSDVTSGTEILEGTTLSFQADVTDVHTWIIGIKEIHGGRLTLKNPSVWCVNKEWAKKENGKHVAKVSFQ